MTVGGPAPDHRAALSLLLWPVVLPGAVLWGRSLRGRVRAIEAYFDVTLRSPGTRGPARDEPKAVAAFRAAQSLPYRLAGYHAFILLLAGVVAVAASRRLLSLPLASAVQLLGALALVVAMSAIYGTLFGAPGPAAADPPPGLAARPAGGADPLAGRPAAQAGGGLRRGGGGRRRG